MAKKYYAVRKGRNTGIFLTWNECKAQVEGFKGAEYKSFTETQEAEQYLNKVSNNYCSASNSSKDREGKLLAYVDGSYNKDNNVSGYGIVLVENEEVLYTEKMALKDNKFNSHRNIFGEVKASERAVQIALERGFKSVCIVYDYKGVEYWMTGEWECRNELTQQYKRNMDDYKKDIEISFIKVKSHASEENGGDKFNEMADKLAKEAVGVL